MNCPVTAPQGKLDLLMVEDSVVDAELSIDALREEGLELNVRRVEDEKSFIAALEKCLPDAILADWTLPNFSGERALEISKVRCPDVPLIFVSGTISEDTAIDAVRHGAIDYVYKHKLNLLGPVLKRALSEARSLYLLRESEDKFKYIFDHSIFGKSITFPTGEINVNEAFCQMLGYSNDELINAKWQDVSHPEDIELTQIEIDSLLSGQKKSARFVKRYIHKSGSVVWCDIGTSLRRDIAGNPLYFITTASDITELKRAESALKRTNRALHTLSAGNGVLIRSTSESELLTGICHAAVEKGGYRMAWVGYVEHDEAKSIRLMAQNGFEDGYVAKARISWSDDELGNGPSGRALRSGKIQISQNIAEDPTMLPWREEALKRGYSSSIALPLIESEKSFGVLTIYSSEIDAFVSEEIELLEEMANDLSFGIVTLRVKEAHGNQEQRLNKNMLQTVEAIASIVEMRDPYTSGHQARVAKLAQSIAETMRLPEEQVYAIHLAGLVHDLGKIKIPSEILSKPGRLDEIEYMLIKKHSQAGFDILNSVDFSWPIAQMVLQHHERMDGSGYPQGLKENDILIGARILCVADVVEAMSSHRPYRPGLGIDAALDEITRSRGSLYDPLVVDACVNLFKNEAYVITK